MNGIMRKIILVMFALLLATAVLADGSEICDYIINHEKFSVGKTLPDKVPYSNEVANLYTLDEELIGHIIIVDKIVTEMNCTEVVEPTYNVYIKDVDTIKDIESAESPADEVDDKMSAGDIIIKGTSFGKKTKALFTRIVIKVASWFS